MTSTGSGDDNRNSPRLLLHRPRCQRALGDDRVGTEALQLLRVGADAAGIVTAEAHLNPQVMVFDPAQLRQSVSERGNAGLINLIFGPGYQHPDQTHSFRLLRPHDHRPRCHPGQSRDEFPPSHP